MSGFPTKMVARRNSSHGDSSQYAYQPYHHAVYDRTFAPLQDQVNSNLHLQYDYSQQSGQSQRFYQVPAYAAQQPVQHQYNTPAPFLGYGPTYHGSYHARAGPFQAQSTLYSNGQTIANQCEQACADFVPSMHQRQTPVYSQQQLQRVHLGQSYPRTQMPQPVMQGGPISGVSGSFQQHALVHEAYPATAQQAQPLYPDTEYVGSTADDSLAQQPRSPSASLILVTAESIARDMQANGQTPPVQRSYSSHNQPGPCKASDVQRYWDGNEVPWIRFEYNQKHVPETVNIRIDIEDMSVDHIPEDFKRKNCCYPGAHGLPRKKSTREPKPPRSANHPHTLYEKDCNIRGWKLAWKNPGVLCGKPGKLQRAEQSYCNATGRESRRVRKQRRRADATKKAEAQHHAPMQQQMLLHVDSWTQEQNQAMPPPQPSALAVADPEAHMGTPNGSTPSSLSTTMPPTPRSSAANLQANMPHGRNSKGKRGNGYQRRSRPGPTSMARSAEHNTGEWSSSNDTMFMPSDMTAADCTQWSGVPHQGLAPVGNGFDPYPQQSYSSYDTVGNPVFGVDTLGGNFDMYATDMANAGQDSQWLDIGDWNPTGYQTGFVFDPADYSGFANHGSDGDSGQPSSSGSDSAY